MCYFKHLDSDEVELILQFQNSYDPKLQYAKSDHK